MIISYNFRCEAPDANYRCITMSTGEYIEIIKSYDMIVVPITNRNCINERNFFFLGSISQLLRQRTRGACETWRRPAVGRAACRRFQPRPGARHVFARHVEIAGGDWRSGSDLAGLDLPQPGNADLLPGADRHRHAPRSQRSLQPNSTGWRGLPGASKHAGLRFDLTQLLRASRVRG